MLIWHAVSHHYLHHPAKAALYLFGRRIHYHRTPCPGLADFSPLFPRLSPSLLWLAAFPGDFSDKTEDAELCDLFEAKPI